MLGISCCVLRGFQCCGRCGMGRDGRGIYRVNRGGEMTKLDMG
jgi:hypothetical protein